MKAGQPSLTASSIGAIAAELLDEGGEVEVVAAFDRSAYLLCPRGLVCIGVPSIGRGPINVLVSDQSQWPDGRAFGLHEGVKGVAGRRQLSIGPDLVIATQGAPIWSPPAFPEAASYGRGVAALRASMPSRLPTDGVSALVFDASARSAKTPTAQAAAPQVAALANAIGPAMTSGQWSAEASRAALLLLGLGPGLTPSGDDFLGGVMLALTARGHAGLRDALWDLLAQELDDLTVPVSAMHLSAAADGMGAEVLHDLIDALASGDEHRIAPALDLVLALGATSGADTVAGLAVGLGDQ